MRDRNTMGKNKRDFTLAAFIATLSLLAVVGAGWVMNLEALFRSGETMGPMELILRVGGVFMPPVGAVLGYF